MFKPLKTSNLFYILADNGENRGTSADLVIDFEGLKNRSGSIDSLQKQRLRHGYVRLKLNPRLSSCDNQQSLSNESKE